MNVLFTVAEAAPFIKTGGLADVAGSLPKALLKKGVDVRVVLPMYSKIDEKYRNAMEKVGEFYVDLDWKHQYAGIYTLEYDKVTYYFIDNKEYFDRSGIYGFGDDAERFIFFSKACVMLPKILDFKVDIFHSHDWHTALVNVFLNDFRRGDDFYIDMRSVYTIHNLKYQGVFSPSVLKLAGLSPYYFNEDDLKFYDSVNFMKGGIVHCTAFTTVSNTYATEIQYPFFGENLDGVVRAHNHKLYGIVNGIDYDVWNPETDTFVSKNYTLATIKDRIENKRALQELYGLPIKDDVPMIGMVTRLTDMKGLDLVRYILDELLQEDIQLVVLGTGDYTYEEMFGYFQWRYPEKVASRIYYNNKESHMIYGAADLYLMPSVAEPCGISQLIALRYGSVPIVRETGGLKDTIAPFDEDTGKGVGFTFSNINAHDLLYTTKMAIESYHKPKTFQKIIKNAMTQRNDWEASSEEYIEVYESLLK